MTNPTKVVPVEPTEEMLHAARDWSLAKYGQGVGNDAAAGCYKAMLSAAPPASILDDLEGLRERWKTLLPGTLEGVGLQQAASDLNAIIEKHRSVG